MKNMYLLKYQISNNNNNNKYFYVLFLIIEELVIDKWLKELARFIWLRLRAI